MVGKKKNGSAPPQATEKTYGQFDDKLTVYTASSGTQYVLPTDILFTEAQKKELESFLDDLRAGHREKKK